MAITARLTADDLLAMPDDGYRYEVIDGELVRMPPAAEEHSEIGLALGALLRAYVRPRKLGRAYGADVGYQLEDDPLIILGPDASYVRAERLPRDRDRSKYLRLAPDIAVEVASPGDRRRRVTDEVGRWQRYGVPLVVVVWPRTRTLDLHRRDRPTVTLAESDEFAADDILPGFRFRVSELFDDE